MFLAGVAIFGAASAWCGFAGSLHQLILARAVQGIGAAFLVPGSLSLIGASFDDKQRGQAIGTWSGSTAITTAIGPLVGGWLIQHLSWRSAFFINVPLAIIVAAIATFRVPESRSAHRQPIDWWGALAVTLGLAGVVFGFVESANLGWRDARVIGSLCGGTLCLMAFLFIEANVSSPMVPLSFFRSSAFSGANLLTLLLYAALGIFFFLLPLDLIQVQGYSATAAGAAMLPMILLIFLLSRWSGGLVSRYGARRPLIIGPLVAAAGFLLFSLASARQSYWEVFFPAMLVLGFGMTLSVAPLTTVIMQSLERDRAGTASGINNAVARVAGLLAVAVFGVVIVAAFGHHLNRLLDQVAAPPEVRSELQSHELELAALRPPAGLDPEAHVAIENSIVAAFLYGFRLIMWICAGLATASAIVAWRTIGSGVLPEPVSAAPKPQLHPIPSGSRVQRRSLSSNLLSRVYS